MHENLGYLVAVVGSDAVTAFAAGEPLTSSQLVGYVVAAILGGGAAYKVLPILMARLAASAAGARSEKDAIERLEGQLAEERKNAEAARTAANGAFKERNDLVLDLGQARAEVAALTERAAYQLQTIERQSAVIADLTEQLRTRQEESRGKAS